MLVALLAPARPATPSARTSSPRSARTPCFPSGAGTRTRRRRPVRGPALAPREVSRAESQETRNSPHAGNRESGRADLLAHERRLSAPHAEHELVKGWQARRPRDPAAPTAGPGRTAVAGCLRTAQSAATSKRPALSLSRRSSHRRPYPRRCCPGRAAALMLGCCFPREQPYARVRERGCVPQLATERGRRQRASSGRALRGLCR